MMTCWAYRAVNRHRGGRVLRQALDRTDEQLRSVKLNAWRSTSTETADGDIRLGA
jgi:hypothetical protein